MRQILGVERRALGGANVVDVEIECVGYAWAGFIFGEGIAGGRSGGHVP